MSELTWQPTASIANLRKRAEITAKIRKFFAKRKVLEVETPILSRHTVTDLHIASFSTYQQYAGQQQAHFLQTSPEYAMKRLLAAGSGCIYQFTKAFRDDELGRWHNPEFTLLEWYRIDFDHFALMREIDQLLQSCLQTAPAKQMSYQQVFIDFLEIDPLVCSIEQLRDSIKDKNVLANVDFELDKDSALQLLMTHCIESKLGFEAPVFIYHYPASQAALARLSEQDPRVAERFELYIQGTELANGFHELTDVKQQHQRFLTDQQLRRQQGLPVPEIDQRLLDALAHGLPDCSGVALGIDRLIALMLSVNSIEEVISFAWGQA